MLMHTAIRVQVAHPEPLVHRGMVATLHASSRFQVDEQRSGTGYPQMAEGVRLQVLITDLHLGIAAALHHDSCAPAVLVLSTCKAN